MNEGKASSASSASSASKSQNIEQAIEELEASIDFMEKILVRIEKGDVPMEMNAVDGGIAKVAPRSIAQIVSQMPEIIYSLADKIKNQGYRLEEMLF